VVAVFDVELSSAGAPTAVRVEVTRDGAPVSGAVVIAGADDENVTLQEASPGHYDGTLAGAHAAYSLSVDTRDGGLDGVALVAPAPQQASLSDSVKSSKLAWAPCREGNVDDVRVALIPSSNGAATYDVHTGDDGALTLPEEPLRDDAMWMRLERSSSARLGAFGIGFVHMTTMTSVASLRNR
jgi:hypothetical protein